MCAREFGARETSNDSERLRPKRKREKDKERAEQRSEAAGVNFNYNRHVSLPFQTDKRDSPGYIVM